MQIWYSYLRYTGRFFLGYVLFVVQCDIIRASWETNKERLSCRKKYIEEFVWGTSLFWLHFLLSMSFFIAFFVYSLPIPKWRTCWIAPIKIYNIALVGITPPVNSRKYDDLLQFNTSWLASLRAWYYFRLFFSFSCSGYAFN